MAAKVKPLIRVIQQDYHRNGVGGAGFIVSLVEWDEAAEEHDIPNPFLAISFPQEEFFGQPEGTYTPETRRRHFEEHTAVLNVADVAALNIEQGWRGADSLGPAVAEAWRQRCLSERVPYDPWQGD